MKLRNLMTSIGFVVLGGCTFNASCNAGRHLNMKNAEALVEKSVAADTKLEAKATCPKEVKAEKGARFDCQVVVGGVTATVTLEQKDDKSYVEVVAVSGLLVTAKLEAVIVERLGKQSTAKIEVDCGPRVRASTPGDSFQCHARDAAGATADVEVKVKDAVGNVDFKVVNVVPAPPPAAPAAPAAPVAPPPEAPAQP